MPQIGITIGTAVWEERRRYNCPGDYVRAVLAAGGRPVLLPAEYILAEGSVILTRFDGFVLSGGGDLDPRLFGQQPHPATGEPDRARDQAELNLARWAVAAGCPLLAICRGLQVLNVALGGDLLQDLPSAGYSGHYQAKPRTERTHSVVPSPDTPLARLIPAPVMVNSFHHQAIARLAKTLVPAASSADGIVEAVVATGRPVIGVQWHPENYAHLAADAAALFAWLVGEAGGASGLVRDEAG